MFESTVYLESVALTAQQLSTNVRYFCRLAAASRLRLGSGSLSWMSDNLADRASPSSFGALLDALTEKIAVVAGGVVPRPKIGAVRAQALVVPPNSCVLPLASAPLGPITWSSVAYLGGTRGPAVQATLRFTNPSSAYRASTAVAFTQFGLGERYLDIALEPGCAAIYPSWLTCISLPHRTASSLLFAFTTAGLSVRRS